MNCPTESYRVPNEDIRPSKLVLVNAGNGCPEIHPGIPAFAGMTKSTEVSGD
jgi:hypothetical protein